MSNQKTPTLTEEQLQNSLTDAVMAAIAAGTGNRTGPAANAGQMATRRMATVRCPDCGQYELACGREHRMAIVYPQSHAHTKWFSGVVINGIRYQSPNANTPTMVPANADVEGLVRNWEGNEQYNTVSRNMQHFSGSISPAGANYIPWQAV